MQTARFLVATMLVASVSACSSGRQSQDDDGFVGKWQWQPGSTSSVVCNGSTVSSTDLSNPNGDGTPAWFTISEVADERLRDVDVLGCVHAYTRDGDVATIIAGSTCSSYPDGHGGTITATTTTTGQKKLSADGQTLTGGGEETVEGQPCRLVVAGTAARASR